MSEELLEDGALGTEGSTAEATAPELTQPEGGTLLSGTLSQEDGAKEAADTTQTYDLKNPEGSNWNEAHLEAFQQQARELGLSNEQAQKMLNMAHGNQQAAVEAHQAKVKQWFNEIRMDKEMGGAAFAATDMYATAAIRKFDHEGRLAELLQTSGYVNHPEVIRALSRVGRALGEDTLVTGREAAAQAPLEDRLYPNSNK